MGIPKTPVDIIEETHHVNVEWKITTFLEDYKFPSFPSDRQTADFILEALQRASLHKIIADVEMDLELVLNLKGTLSVCTPSLSFHCTRMILSYFCVFCARHSVKCTLCTKTGKMLGALYATHEEGSVMIIAILYSTHRMDCGVSFLPWETGNLAL